MDRLQTLSRSAPRERPASWPWRSCRGCCGPRRQARSRPGDLSSVKHFSPYAYRNVPDKVFFGDMHIHSNLSPDAGPLGTSLSAADVFRAARGETVRSNTGQPFRLIRPLDFLVLTDHAEAMGLATMVRESNPVLLSSKRGREVWV